MVGKTKIAIIVFITIFVMFIVIGMITYYNQLHEVANSVSAEVELSGINLEGFNPQLILCQIQ